MQRTGLEWAEIWAVTILDPDGFGERTKDMPKTTELMGEKTFHKCIVKSTCQFHDPEKFFARMQLFRGWLA